MKSEEFWQLVKPEIPSAVWELLQNRPSLAVQLIVEKTLCQNPIDIHSQTALLLSAIKPEVSLCASQEIALQLSLGNTPLTVIQGPFGSGKTRIALVAAEELIRQEKSLLLLTHHRQTLAPYDSLSKSISVEEDHLANLSMEFLPNYLLPDRLLSQLRSRGKLEKWVGILQKNPDLEEIKSHLRHEFPDWSMSRLTFLAFRLTKLLSLLQKQLWLEQRSQRLSPEAKTHLSREIAANQIKPIVATIAEFWEENQQKLEELCFDCVIVEEAEYLSWGQLICLAGIARKLILLGNLPMSLMPLKRKAWIESRPLFWLGEYLLPSYRYQLTHQFRLHNSLARPIVETLYDQWISTESKAEILTLPQLGGRCLWENVCSSPVDGINLWEGTKLLKFMGRLGAPQPKQLGIVAFTEAQRDWLIANLPEGFEEVRIATCEGWIAKEVEILLVSCVGDPEKLRLENLAIALTRALDYLIIFGDYAVWSQKSSPLQALANHPDLYRQREVSLK